MGFLDPTGDPVRFNNATDVQRPARLARNVDVTRTVFDYRRDQLVVRAKAERASEVVELRVQVRTQRADYFFYALSSDGGVVELDNDRPCRGATAEVQMKAGVYVVKIPARCFGAPVTVQASLAPSRAAGPSATAYDDALRKGYRRTLPFAVTGPISRG